MLFSFRRTAESEFEVNLDSAPGNVLLMTVLYPPAVGGFSTYAKQVAAAYTRAGIGVTVITARDAPVGLTKEGDIDVYNVYYLPRHRELDRLSEQLVVFWRIFRCAIRCLRRQDYSLVHTTHWYLSVIALALGMGARTVVSVHGRELFVLPRLLKRMLHICLRRARAILAISHSTLDRLRQEAHHQLPHAGVSWTGISFQPRAESHRPSADFSRLFCMCRLEERKNLPGAMQAVRLLVDEGFDVHLFIAGDGRERESVAAERTRLGLENHVALLGQISDEEAIRHYCECGIFLHPQIATDGGNDIEGFGIAVADAMSFGCIPVAGAAGGPSDYICDGETGFLVDGRSPAAIAKSLRMILTNPEKSGMIAHEAQRFALEHFSWDKHIQDILKLAHRQENAQ